MAGELGGANTLNGGIVFLLVKHLHSLWGARMCRSSLAIYLGILLILAQPPRALFWQKDQSVNASLPTVSPAADGIFAAFQRRPIVALSDDHGMAQEEDFYASLIRDKRFEQSILGSRQISAFASGLEILRLTGQKPRPKRIFFPSSDSVTSTQPASSRQRFWGNGRRRWSFMEVFISTERSL
jgi:hypothetical protein